MFQVVHPNVAIPLLFDRERSPVIALDTEFEPPACYGNLHGVSMAGGTPETGFVGCFWPYGRGAEEIAPWGWLRDKVLKPLLGDPVRTFVMHPPKVDFQPLYARGISPEDVKCEVECTFSMAHLLDENLPKGLKDLTACVFHIETKSYEAVQQEMKKIVREGKKAAKAAINTVWEVYRDYRKGSLELEIPLDPTWDELVTIAMSMPPKLKKADVVAVAKEHVESKIVAEYERKAQERFNKYGADDALYTLGLRYWMRDRLKDTTHLELETKVCHPVVTEMEMNGLYIDVERLGAIHEAMTSAISALRDEVCALWGVSGDDLTADKEGEFNPGSPDQVARTVWLEWKLRPPPWTQQGGEIKPKWLRSKDGLCKCDKEVLKHLARTAQGHHGEAIRKLLELRRYSKIMSGYVDPMLEKATTAPDQRIHSSFWPVGARTGRFSSSDPNVENIPRPTTMPTMPIPPDVLARLAAKDCVPRGVVYEEDKDKNPLWRIDSLREVIIPPDGWSLVSLDLSQIENRLIAHESQDPVMLWLYRHWDCAECGASGETNEPLHACPKCKAPDGKRDKFDPDQPALKGFCLGRDIHSATASDPLIGYFDKYGPVDGRNRGKTLNHSATYGMSDSTMARRDGVPVKEAKHGLAGWHGKYRRVRPLQDRMKADVREKGYVTMFDGHVRHFFPQRLLVRSENFRPWEWEGIVREAVNVLAQGGTAVIMKRAMLAVRERILSHENPLVRETKLVNQVHDEVLYEARQEVTQEVFDIVRWELEHAVELSVPVIAEGAVGSTWGQAH